MKSRGNLPLSDKAFANQYTVKEGGRWGEGKNRSTTLPCRCMKQKSLQVHFPRYPRFLFADFLLSRFSWPGFRTLDNAIRKRWFWHLSK